jgi:hypothetical protein
MASSFVTYSRGLTMITPEARAATWWKAGSCAARKQGASGNDLAMALLWSACVFVVGVSVSTRSLCLGSCLAWGLHVVPTHHEYKACIHSHDKEESAKWRSQRECEGASSAWAGVNLPSTAFALPFYTFSEPCGYFFAFGVRLCNIGEKSHTFCTSSAPLSPSNCSAIRETRNPRLLPLFSPPLHRA